MSNCQTTKEIWETLEFDNKNDKKNQEEHIFLEKTIMWLQILKNKEQTHLSLIVSHHSDDDDDEVSDFESINKPSHDELCDAFNDLYDECIKLYKLNAK